MLIEVLDVDPDVLVKALFTPAKEPNPRYLDKFIYLLAYAASVSDERSIAAVPTHINNDVIDTTQLDATKEALEQIYQICHANTNGSELTTSITVLEEKLWYILLFSRSTCVCVRARTKQ
jgi:hypothetical protein